MVITQQKLARKIGGFVGIRSYYPPLGQLVTKKDSYSNTKVEIGDHLYAGDIMVGIALTEPDQDGFLKVMCNGYY